MTADTPLGEQLEQARDALGLTWEEVASAAGISPQALRKIRSGESYPRRSTLRALEEALLLPDGELTSPNMRVHVGTREGNNDRAAWHLQTTFPRNPTEPRSRRPDAIVAVNDKNGDVQYLIVEVKRMGPTDTKKLARLLQRFADVYTDFENEEAD